MIVLELLQTVALRALMAAEALAYFWQVSLPVVAAGVLAIAYGSKTPGNVRHTLPWILWAFPLFMLTWGVLFEHRAIDVAAPGWPRYGLFALLGFQAVASAGIVARMRGRRWYAAGVALLAGLYGLGACVFSVMSVTGTWL